ncbi:MAG: hypothetical protein ACLS67_23745 [Anaerobutyricum soehngenii]
MCNTEQQKGKADGTVYRYTCQVGRKICHLTYEEKDRRSETAIRSKMKK